MEIQEIIENSFTPDSLSMAGSEYFIDCFLQIDPQLIIWSEGDVAWQKLKAFKTGLTNRCGIKTEFISENKGDGLRDIILSLAEADQSEEEILVIVVDDKEENLIHALGLQEQILDNRITIGVYHFNLQDAQTNPEACLAFLSELTEKNVRLIVDMDGVLINTDYVLSEIVSKKLALLLAK